MFVVFHLLAMMIIVLLMLLMMMMMCVWVVLILWSNGFSLFFFGLSPTQKDTLTHLIFSSFIEILLYNFVSTIWALLKALNDHQILGNKAGKHSGKANRNRIILKAILTFETNAHLGHYREAEEPGLKGAKKRVCGTFLNLIL